MKRIYIPKKVKKISAYAFGLHEKVGEGEDHPFVKNKGFKIYSNNNKAAKAYAKKYKIKHIKKK